MIIRWLSIFFLLISCGFAGAFVYVLENEVRDFSALEKFVTTKPSIILDDQGKELARFALDKRTPITYAQIPDVVIKAFTAAEDHKFFSHHGISIKGIIRSALVNLYYRRVVQGASTITQQVARLMFLTQERTFLRKFKEAILALHLERQLTKPQILELYLNNMYFGRGIYGVQAACKRFWNKSIENITLDEAATLAAVAKSARFYSPLNAPLTARKRRNIILRSMRNLGYLTQKEFKQTKKLPLIIEDHIPGNPIRLYIQEWVRAWAEQKWGKQALYTKGLKIKTTINQEMQKHAEKSFSDMIQNVHKKISPEVNGGMMSIDVTSGKIKTLIGGSDFRMSQFNRAFQAYRQIGSSFKPILYALALTSGFDMDSVFVDEPIEIESQDKSVYKPRNWTRTFEGPMTLVRALTFSNNIIAVKLLLEVGVQRLISMAKRFNITRELYPYPSLALGTAHASVEENAAAFNTFANNGVYVKPFLIEWVRNEWGRKIWAYKPESHRVLDPKTNAKMLKALSYRIKRAKNFFRHEKWIDTEAIGKTGANNGATTTWFLGSTPELTTAVYLGRDDNKPMGRYVYANQIVFPIWLHFTQSITTNKKQFYFDPGLQEVTINWKTGEKVYPMSNKNKSSHVVVLK